LLSELKAESHGGKPKIFTPYRPISSSRRGSGSHPLRDSIVIENAYILRRALSRKQDKINSATHLIKFYKLGYDGALS
jgi:hypothetical protein